MVELTNCKISYIKNNYRILTLNLFNTSNGLLISNIYGKLFIPKNIEQCDMTEYNNNYLTYLTNKYGLNNINEIDMIIKKISILSDKIHIIAHAEHMFDIDYINVILNTLSIISTYGILLPNIIINVNSVMKIEDDESKLKLSNHFNKSLQYLKDIHYI